MRKDEVVRLSPEGAAELLEKCEWKSSTHNVDHLITGRPKGYKYLAACGRWMYIFSAYKARVVCRRCMSLYNLLLAVRDGETEQEGSGGGGDNQD